MSDNFKPGDVAVATLNGKVRLLRYLPDDVGRVVNPWVMDPTYDRADYVQSNWQHTDPRLENFRVLPDRFVILDPKAPHSGRDWDWWLEAAADLVPSPNATKRSMLRRLAEIIGEQANLPGIEEPTGFGAIVVGEQGTRWSRTGLNDSLPWRSRDNGTVRAWQGVHAAEVLFEGIDQ